MFTMLAFARQSFQDKAPIPITNGLTSHQNRHLGGGNAKGGRVKADAIGIAGHKKRKRKQQRKSRQINRV